MTDKIPVRGVFSGTTATGLAEFQTGEKIAVSFGGTGATSHTANALLLGDGTSAIQSSTITLDGTTFATSDSTTITIAEGLVVTGDLTVQGTTTSIDSSSINVTDRFVFEGSSADANETTLIVENPDADRTVTIPNATGTIVLKDTTDTLTNKTISGSSNTLTNIPNSAITNSSISINSTVVSLGGSITIPTAESGFISFGDESSNNYDAFLFKGFSFLGGEGIDTTISGPTLTIAGEDATSSNKGIASFSSDDFAVSSGAVTVKASGITNAQLAGSIANDKLAGSIANAKLANSTITVAGDSGSTAIDLGDTLTVSGTSNEIETSQSGDTLTIGLPDNVTIAGNLTVNGTTTTVATTNTNVKDQLFELGNGRTGSASGDAGIVIERGDDANLFIGYDESADKFTVGTGSFTGASTGNLTITRGEIVANLDGSNSTVTNLPNSALTNSSITIGDESSNTFDINLGDEVSFVGGEGIDTTITGNLMTIAGEDASTSNKGIASFSSDDFAVSSGAVTVKAGGITNTQLAGSIANAKLANSSITINGSGVSLGGSVSIDTSFTLAADSGSNDSFSTGNTLTFSGGEGIDTTVSDDEITIAGEDATTSNKGIASFSSDDFSVSSGAVTVKSGGITNAQLAGSIANAKLANSAITINGSSVSLGGSATITGSELSTAGDIFSNYNTVSSNADITTASTKNSFLFGEINISSNAVLDIGGNGTLEII